MICYSTTITTKNFLSLVRSSLPLQNHTVPWRHKKSQDFVELGFYESDEEADEMRMLICASVPVVQYDDG